MIVLNVLVNVGFFFSSLIFFFFFFFFSSRRRHTRFDCDWSSDVCSSDLWYFNISLPLSHGSVVIGSPNECQSRHLGQIKSGNHLSFVPGRIIGSIRSEERRVGKECRSRWSPYH